MKKFTFLQEATLTQQQLLLGANITNIIQNAQLNGYVNKLTTYLNTNELFYFANYFKLNAVGLSGGLKQNEIGNRKTEFAYQVKTNNFNTLRQRIQALVNKFVSLQLKNNTLEQQPTTQQNANAQQQNQQA